MSLSNYFKKSHLFLFLWGIIITLWKYKFGVGDQLDHLLFVYKALDKSFLLNDPYIQSIDGFSVRTYFTALTVLLTKILPLEIVYFFLTTLSNLTLVFGTYTLAYKLTNNTASALLAPVLVGSLTLVYMGDGTTLFLNGLSPAGLVFSLFPWALVLMLSGKVIKAMIICGIMSLLHISMGFMAGFILLAAYPFLQKKNISWKTLFAGIAMLFGFSMITLIPYFFERGDSIASEMFMDIYVRFRAPHHLLYAYVFTKETIIRASLFFTGSAVSAYLLYKYKIIRSSRGLFLMAIAGVIIDLNILGFLLVGWLNHPLGAMLQAMRYFSFLKYLAIILIACFLGQLIYKRQWLSVLYLSLSLLSPVLTGAMFTFYLIQTQFKKYSYFPWVGLVLCLGYLLNKQFSPETWVYTLGLLLVVVAYKVSLRWNILIYSVVISLLVIKILLPIEPAEKQSWSSQNFQPDIWGESILNDVKSVCSFVEENTPNEALFMAPPGMLEMRVFGKRALLSNFKAIPFKANEMLAWYERIQDCYGATNALGFAAEQELIERYKRVDIQLLVENRKRYGVSHAILFAETPMAWPVLYSNEHFKVIEITGFDSD